MAPKNYFETLEISIGADESQIKKAYRTLAKKWHPDKNSNPGAKEKFQEIAAAYEYLSSKDRREILERDLLRAKTQSQEKQSQPASTFKPDAPRPSENTSKTPTKKPNAASWSETFTKNYRSQQDKANKASAEKTYSGSGEKKKFNFKFTDFKPNRSPSPVSETDDLYDELFGDLLSPRGFAASRDILGSSKATKKKKPKPRHVAPERGSPTGLDEEYLFTPRHKAQDDSQEKLSCPWCNQAFTRGKLSQHEEKCGKFGLSADEESEDEVDVDLDVDINYITTLSKPMNSWKPVWQQKQDELREKIRKDKSLYKEHLASHDNKSEGLIKCPYCERQFNYTSASKHIPWCKEYVQKYGIPMNRRSSIEKDTKMNESDFLFEALGKKRTQDTGAVRERMKEYASTTQKHGHKRENRQEDYFVPGNSMPYRRKQANIFGDFPEDEAFISGNNNRSSFQAHEKFSVGVDQPGTSAQQYKMYTQGLHGKKL